MQANERSVATSFTAPPAHEMRRTVTNVARSGSCSHAVPSACGSPQASYSGMASEVQITWLTNSGSKRQSGGVSSGVSLSRLRRSRSIRSLRQLGPGSHSSAPQRSSKARSC